MSGNYSQLDLSTESSNQLTSVGFTEGQIDAIKGDIASANTIVATKNRDVLHTLTYSELRNQPELLGAYDRLDDGETTLEDVVLLMRRTKLSSAALARTVSTELSNENYYKQIDSYINYNLPFQPHIRMYDDERPVQAKIKVVRNLAHVGITSFVVKESVGTLVDTPEVNVVRRLTFAGINQPREVDVKALLGWQERHPNDSRDAVVVPISTTHILHR